MFRLKLWRGLRAVTPPARRPSKTARLAVEVLEDRLALSAVGPFDPAHEAWKQQTFHVDDVAVADVTPQVDEPSIQAGNSTFGPLIGLPDVFNSTSYRGGGYSVAVIDTGIDYNHASLGGGFGAGHRVIAGYDFANNDANPMDDNGHGTHVAGIIGSSNSSYSGVAPQANLIALKVLDANGSGSFGNVERALQWVMNHRAQYNIVAVNLSLGTGNYTSNPYSFLTDEFSSLRNGGVFISVAAGNSFYSYNSAPGLGYPAIDGQVASVGAVYSANFGTVAWASGARDNTTAADRVASFSQRGSALSLMAPGAMITSTYLNNTFRAMAGTSMAAPVVAGAAVLIHQAMDARGLTANQNTILTLMRQTGVNINDGDDENDNVANTGLNFKRLDLAAAIDALGTPANSAPAIAPIAAQTMAPGGTLQLTLSATDPDGDAVTWSARIASAPESQAYQLRQQYGLTYAGDYFLNSFGQNEKWLSSTSGTWYCIFPNGDLRRFTGSMATTLQAANLIATLDPSFYADPSLLWNAQPGGASLGLTLAGNRLTLNAPANAFGVYQIEVTASDGELSATRTFTVSILANTAPRVDRIGAQSMYAGRTLDVALSATDEHGDPISYRAEVEGSYATLPGTLVVNGDRLTIHASPDFAGAFSIRVYASDGELESSRTFQVTVTLPAGAKRFAGDFNGDGVEDTAIYNAGGAWWVSIAASNGTFVNGLWTRWAPKAAWRTLRVGDFNGDGKTDIAGFGADGVWQVGLSTGSSFGSQSWADWAPSSVWASLHVGDFNGDGKDDIAGFKHSGVWYVGLSTGAAFDSSRWGRWSAASNWSTVRIGDFNGDGLADVIGFKLNGVWSVGQSTGAYFDTSAWARWSAASAWRTLQVGDFDGDGKDDVLGFSHAGGVRVGLSTGADFVSSAWARWSVASNWKKLTLADVDADGLLDLVGKNKNGHWYVAYSTGEAFRTETWTAESPPIGR